MSMTGGARCRVVELLRAVYQKPMEAVKALAAGQDTTDVD